MAFPGAPPSLVLDDYLAIQSRLDSRVSKIDQALRRTFALPKPYPPSTKSLAALQKTQVSQLDLNTRHRGKALWLKKTTGKTLFLSHLYTVFVAVDETSQSILVEIPLADQRLGGSSLFPKGTVFALKEPVCIIHKLFVQQTLEVHHLSDMVVVYPPDPRAPALLQADADTTTGALQMKERGNILLRQKDYAGAVMWYTKGIDRSTAADTDVRRDLFRNRAEANLALGRYDKAIEDAVHDFSGNLTLDTKAVYRAVKACYQLGHHDIRTALAEPLRAISGGGHDADMRKIFTAIDARLREEKTGIYDFETILKKLSKERPRVDAASYVKKVEVKEPGTHASRGLFAREDIDTGELIFCEKAFMVMFMHEDGAALTQQHDERDGLTTHCNYGLWRAVLNHLMHNPSQIPTITQLAEQHSGTGKDIVEIDGQPVIDSFQ